MNAICAISRNAKRRPRRSRWSRWLLGTMWVVGAAGCGAPPALEPLLEVADKALQQEVQHQQEDLARDAEQFAQARRNIDQGFAADLRERATLDADWVSDAAQVYAQAREALARREEALKNQRQIRVDNLHAAAAAQERAMQLLEMQRQWLDTQIGLDLWRLTLPAALQAATVTTTP